MGVPAWSSNCRFSEDARLEQRLDATMTMRMSDAGGPSAGSIIIAKTMAKAATVGNFWNVTYATVWRSIS